VGSTNFFSKLASIDPLAQALNLPGAHKYAQNQAQANAGATDTNGGAYTGVNATLAGANAGYKPGGPGATIGFAPTQPTPGNSLFGKLQGAANLSGNVSAQPWASGSLNLGATPNVGAGTTNPYVQGSQTMNPYAAAARGAVPQAPRQQSTWGG
jgi:hypothetical protein